MALRIRSELPEPRPTGEGVSVTVRFHWVETCVVGIDDDLRPDPPRLPTGPAVYRLRFDIPGTEYAAWYIGETGNLDRRIGTNYRTPQLQGRGQSTNRKINESIRNTALFGGRTFLDIAAAACVGVAGAPPMTELDLARKNSRVLVESAAICEIASSENVMLLNHCEDEAWAALMAARDTSDW